MDFFKSLLSPLKIPKLKKLKQWNGGSILNLQQLKNLPSRSRNVGTVASSVVKPAPEPPAIQNGGGAKCHSRKRSDISIISGSVPTSSRVGGVAGGSNGNYGLYALKCDRNAAKRGILLNLPRKMVAVMGGGNGGGGDSNLDGCSYQSEEMVHEKFSPCKRVVEPPPRRKRMRKRGGNEVGPNPMKDGEGREFYCGDRLLERNRSELFRIAERGSNEHLNSRRDEPAPPPPGLITSGRKTRSADNILVLKRYYPGEGGAGDSESDDAEQVRSLKVSRMAEWQGPASMPLKYSESMESDTEEVRKRVRRVKLKKANEYSIENDSEKIEVRFRKNHASTESEELVVKPAPPAPPVPLPTRVVALRQQEPKPKVKPKLPEKPPPKKPVEQFVTAKDFADNFKPLASVLQESIKSVDLKRKWINDFLSESDEEPVKKQQSSDSLSKKFALVDKFDRQLEQLEGGGTFITKDSVESVNIFHNGGDFDEFDKLFQGNSRMNSVKKNVTVSEQVTFINQKQSNLNFSSSSFDSDVVRPPIPPPLPPPIGTGATKSTVNIQDYYDKKLQRVRYVSSPSPSRCFDEDPVPPPLQEAVNNNLVLPLSIINQRTVDKCSTTDQNEKAEMPVCSINGSKPYNQNHISCNLNNIHPTNNYIEPRTNTEYSSTNINNSYNNNSASVFIVGETFKAQPPAPTKNSSVKRYINYKFDDYGHIKAVDSSTTTNQSSRPRRTFNINDFHDDCYNEEGVVII